MVDPVALSAVASDEPARIVPPFDHHRAEAAVRELLLAIGEDPDRDGLRETPARVARMYAEVFGGLRMRAADVLTTTFELGHDELVLVKDIEVTSFCEHHLVPFHGVAHMGYIPAEDGRITGLSKLARLVDVYAKRPQVQERLTTQVADSLMRDPAAARRDWSSSSASTCACPCAGCASPVRGRSRPPCAASCSTRRPAPRR